MSRQSVDSGQLLAEPPVDADDHEPMANAEVVVKGRNVEIPDHFRIYVSQKLARLERFDRTIYLFDVELDHERNRRQRKSCQHVEITARGRGPVVRGEACADSFYAALESAVAKLENRLRRSQGPPQGPLRRQDARSRWPRPPRSCRRAEPLVDDTDAASRRADGIEAPRARPDRADQGAPGQADDGRRRALRDGARRTRLLPVPRQARPKGRPWSTGGTPTTTG